MGKPIIQSHSEIKTLIARTKKLIELAPEGLAEKVIKSDDNGFLKITREPVGVVFMITPWNYPLLTPVNCLITSVLAGNSVVLKSSPHAPLTGKHFENAFKYAGLDHLVNDLMVAADKCQNLYTMNEIGALSFTGSVQGGFAVQKDLYETRFIDSILQLGGNDGAYVAPDADLDKAVEGLMDGAMYNSGQSCCSIERIYVHDSLYQEFIERSTQFIKNTYKPGDPNLESTNFGPLCLPEAPEKHEKDVTFIIYFMIKAILD